MGEFIAPCGDNCTACPRYITKSEEELHKAATLWHKLGWTDTILSTEKFRCNGCSIHHRRPLCSYGILGCLNERNISKCNQCSDFPCEKINKMLAKSKQNQENCKKVCSESEYRVLHKAFFCKEMNLKRSLGKCLKD